MQDITSELAQAREQIEAIEPSTERRVLKFNLVFPNGSLDEFQCVQEQLGMFPVQEFVTMMGEFLESFAEGDMGKRIAELFTGDRAVMPDTITAETVQETVDENMPLVQAFFKLIRTAPELQKDVICLSLGISPGQRDWFKGAISRPISQGGLDVDEGFEILTRFVEQNAKLIRRFFEEKGAEFVRTVRKEVLGEEDPVDGTATEMKTPTEPESDSPGSTPSSTSSQGTLVNVS